MLIMHPGVAPADDALLPADTARSRSRVSAAPTIEVAVIDLLIWHRQRCATVRCSLVILRDRMMTGPLPDRPQRRLRREAPGINHRDTLGSGHVAGGMTSRRSWR